MSYPVDSGYNDGDLILAQQSLQYAEIVNAFADNSAFFRQDISTTPNSIRLDYSTGNEISALTDGQVVFFRVRSRGSNTSAVQVVIGPGRQGLESYYIHTAESVVVGSVGGAGNLYVD